MSIKLSKLAKSSLEETFRLFLHRAANQMQADHERRGTAKVSEAFIEDTVKDMFEEIEREALPSAIAAKIGALLAEEYAEEHFADEDDEEHASETS